MSWTHVSYMDETHNADSYWICGVVVHVDNIKRAKDAFIAVADEAETAANLWGRPELHGYELWGGEGDFEDVAPGVRITAYADALDALAASDPMIVLRGVRRPQLKYQHPHRLAWRYAIEAVDQLPGDGPILVVADEHKETESALRSDIHAYIASGTGGWKPHAVKRVMPELRFLDSRSHPLLQAADLVAFLHQRRFNIENESNRRVQRVRESLWRKVAPAVRVLHIWEPPS